MELSSSNIKKFLIFSQKKAFLTFWETETPKNSLCYRKQNFLIFQETEALENFIYFRNNSPSSKNYKKPKQNTMKKMSSIVLYLQRLRNIR